MSQDKQRSERQREPGSMIYLGDYPGSILSSSGLLLLYKRNSFVEAKLHQFSVNHTPF